MRVVSEMDRTSHVPRSNQWGFVLIGIIIVLVVVAVLASMYLGLRGRGGQKAEPRFEGDAQTMPGRAIQKAESVECRSNLNQLRLAIQMEEIEAGSFPAALRREWGVSLGCPVSGYDYEYDPSTGKVRCPTPGHEDY